MLFFREIREENLTDLFQEEFEIQNQEAEQLERNEHFEVDIEIGSVEYNVDEKRLIEGQQDDDQEDEDVEDEGED